MYSLLLLGFVRSTTTPWGSQSLPATVVYGLTSEKSGFPRIKSAAMSPDTPRGRAAFRVEAVKLSASITAREKEEKMPAPMRGWAAEGPTIGAASFAACV